MHKVLVNRLGGISLPRKSVVGLTDRPDMTLDFTVDVKQQQQCIILGYCIDNLFIICLFHKRNSMFNIITQEHLMFLTAYLVTSSLVMSSASF